MQYKMRWNKTLYDCISASCWAVWNVHNMLQCLCHEWRWFFNFCRAATSHMTSRWHRSCVVSLCRLLILTMWHSTLPLGIFGNTFTACWPQFLCDFSCYCSWRPLICKYWKTRKSLGMGMWPVNFKSWSGLSETAYSAGKIADFELQFWVYISSVQFSSEIFRVA